MNKFDRVISILILLQTKKVIKATDIAEKFDVSLRTVYRDIRTLENAGIPIIGEPGVGYSLMDGYRLPPVMFNEEEALSLLTAEKFIAKISDEQTGQHYVSAMEKIRAVLRGPEKDSLAVLDESIVVSTMSKMEDKNFLTDIFKSISGRRVLFMKYKTEMDAHSERDIEPVGCYYHYNNWYLVAFCRVRKDYRTFKINRIQSLCVRAETFQNDHPSVNEYLERQAQEQKAELVIVRFKKTVVKFAENDRYALGYVKSEEDGDDVIMTFMTASSEFLCSWIMAFSDQAMVISPPSMKEMMQKQIGILQKHYSE